MSSTLDPVNAGVRELLCGVLESLFERLFGEKVHVQVMDWNRNPQCDTWCIGIAVDVPTHALMLRWGLGDAVRRVFRWVEQGPQLFKAERPKVVVKMHPWLGIGKKPSWPRTKA